MGSVASRLSLSRNAKDRPAPRFEGLAGRQGHGPFFRIFLTIEDKAVISAEYETLGCPWSQKVGATLVSVLRCTSADKTKLIAVEDLARLAGPLPRHKRELPGLAVRALQQALHAWQLEAGQSL